MAPAEGPGDRPEGGDLPAVARGVGCSLHWRPLHLHSYYAQKFGCPADLPAAPATWERLVSLPIFPGMTAEEITAVADAVRGLCLENRRSATRAARA